MEAQLEVERQRRFLTGASEAEINAALNELRRQQEAKKQVRKFKIHLKDMFIVSTPLSNLRV